MPASTVSPTAQAWEAAVAAERAARSAMDRHERLIVQPLHRAHQAGAATSADVRQAEKRWGAYTFGHCNAVDTVITTPAPDVKAVVAKLELGLSTCAFGEEGEHLLRVITDDLIRLAASPR